MVPQLSVDKKVKMADLEDAVYPSGGRRDDSPVDTESRNEREGSRESDHDDRDRRRRGGGYERDLRRESRRYAPYPSQDERSGRRQSGSSGKECRVYVWNLPYTVKWQDLKDFMKKGSFVAILKCYYCFWGEWRGIQVYTVLLNLKLKAYKPWSTTKSFRCTVKYENVFISRS